MRGKRVGHRRSGFSLVELLIAAALASLLLVLAMPAYTDWIRGYRQLNQAQALARALELARSEAIKRSGRVNVCKSTDWSDCAPQGGWESGWLIFADADDDGHPGSPSAILGKEPPAPGQITIVGNAPVANYVSYTNLGTARTRSGALQMGTFSVCTTGQKALHVILANTGRVRIQRTAVPCP